MMGLISTDSDRMDENSINTELTNFLFISYYLSDILDLFIHFFFFIYLFLFY